MSNQISRRHFFLGTLLAGAIPRGGFGTVPSLKALGYQSPNEKLNIGAVGAGGRAVSVLGALASENIVAFADVPANAPNSFTNRGFYISQVRTLQLASSSQAIAVANGLANRGTVFETVTLSTAPDPRHDSYDVIHWNGSLWLELAWTMSLLEGGAMSHTLRKGYTTSG